MIVQRGWRGRRGLPRPSNGSTVGVWSFRLEPGVGGRGLEMFEGVVADHGHGRGPAGHRDVALSSIGTKVIGRIWAHSRADSKDPFPPFWDFWDFWVFWRFWGTGGCLGGMALLVMGG